jgi:membrane associated rhomboid family serine protease
MVFGPVGIRCPECAGHPARHARTVRTARPAVKRPARPGVLGIAGLVTKSLVAVNVVIYIAQLAQAQDARGLDSDLVARGALWGPAVGLGDEWWRLLTAGFLHASPIHLAFNMLMLWWYGNALEGLLGARRFTAIYVVSILAGSAGALLVSPTSPTVGASGAVFGILGAGLYLERRQIYVFGGGAFAVVAINLVLSFVISNVSIGGHIGGLVGGVAAAFALSRFGRGHAAYGRLGLEGSVGLAAIAVLSVLVAYLGIERAGF